MEADYVLTCLVHVAMQPFLPVKAVRAAAATVQGMSASQKKSAVTCGFVRFKEEKKYKIFRYLGIIYNIVIIVIHEKEFFQ